MPHPQHPNLPLFTAPAVSEVPTLLRLAALPKTQTTLEHLCDEHEMRSIFVLFSFQNAPLRLFCPTRPTTTASCVAEAMSLWLGRCHVGSALRRRVAVA
jgi:hypothetical protein